MTSFTVDVYQNEYLPLGGSEVSAIVTVTSGDGHGTDAEPAAAEVVIIDRSGSMAVPGSKIKAAREATGVAVDCIRDGVMFGLIAGTEKAEVLYPSNGELVAASEQSRREAKRAVSKLRADGGTALGTWLRVARRLFDPHLDRVCHAILLTDGENEHETPEQLTSALAACEGRFQCDCRGVGTDWRVSELRRIASALLGSVDIVADPAGLADDFRAMIESAMLKRTRNVALRIWMPHGARRSLIRQVAPVIEELTDRGAEVNPLTADYPTGSWGQESRDYHVIAQVVPHGAGEEMLAARVGVVEGDELLAQGLVRAIWTEDERLSTSINRQVAHYTGQAELAVCVQDGLEARRQGDTGTAVAKLGRAVQLASQSGHEGTLKLLEAVVEVEDAATGTVRLRPQVADADEMALDTRSTKTIRVGG